MAWPSPRSRQPSRAEHDGPPVGHPTREGFGPRLLNRVLACRAGAAVLDDEDERFVRLVAVAMRAP